jgi:hypothetical protein
VPSRFIEVCELYADSCTRSTPLPSPFWITVAVLKAPLLLCVTPVRLYVPISATVRCKYFLQHETLVFPVGSNINRYLGQNVIKCFNSETMAKGAWPVPSNVRPAL